jgi:hypothetical protein
MSKNVKVVWPECEVCHGKGIKTTKEGGWTVCDHGQPDPDIAVDAFVEAMRPVTKTLREQRQPDYGEPRACHYAIALAWNALLMQKLKATDGDASLDERMVALMLATMKLVREAYHHKQDNLDDAKVYLEFVEEFSK